MSHQYSENFRQIVLRFLEHMDRNGDFTDEATAAQGMKPLGVEAAIHIVSIQAIDELTGFISSGEIPETVKSFAECHDYIDANCVGGAFHWEEVCPNVSDSNDQKYMEDHCEFWNAVQSNCDKWIKAGRPDMFF